MTEPLVAIRSFNFTDCLGRNHEVTAYKSAVDPLGEAARRFLSFFAPPGADGYALQRQANREKSERELRDAMLTLEPPRDVSISRATREELQRTAADWAMDGRECGGFLFGSIRPDAFRQRIAVDILEFSRPRTDDHREPGRIRFSAEHFEDAFEGRLSQNRLLGDWHVHLSADSFQPSDTDAGVWSARSDRVSWRPERPAGYLGVILAGNRPNHVSRRMKLSAWFVEPLQYRSLRSENGHLLGRVSTDSEPRPIAIREVG